MEFSSMLSLVIHFELPDGIQNQLTIKKRES